MQFLEAGPEIPDYLVEERDKGTVVFIAGAGVSVGAGLPDFQGLVSTIYKKLGELIDDHPAERSAQDRQEYDRVLYALRRRLHKQADAGDDDLILKHIRRLLRRRSGTSLQRHYDLLRLSLTPRGETFRLITTNFDTLFEAAWEEQRSSKSDSWAAPALPPPGTSRFRGVIHLHGRLSHPKTKLRESELVLTSAEFGEAYLRSGWATRYVYDLARAYTLVLVGYGLNDPPMRYLLEVVAADRDRFKDLNKVFAFVGVQPGERADEVISTWRDGRCVEPILYSISKNDHSSLYETIRAWADRAEDPAAWIRKEIERLMPQRPSNLPDFERKKVLQLLKTDTGASALRSLGRRVPSEWLDSPELNNLIEQFA
jgi:hypothetical protein